MASGFLNSAQNQNGDAFTLIAAFPDGSVAELGTVTSLNEFNDAAIISDYELNQNYPNPFNPSTSITFALPKSEFTTLKIFNIIGEEVASLVNRQLEAGRYTFSFDASRLSSGVYLYKINAGNFNATKKMILNK